MKKFLGWIKEKYGARVDVINRNIEDSEQIVTMRKWSTENRAEREEKTHKLRSVSFVNDVTLTNSHNRREVFVALGGVLHSSFPFQLA